MNIDHIAISIGIDKGTLLNLFSLFIQQTAADLLDIQAAVKQKKWDILKQTAHSIKGAALNMELKEIAAAAKEIEQKAMEGRMEILSPHIAWATDTSLKKTYDIWFNQVSF